MFYLLSFLFPATRTMAYENYVFFKLIIFYGYKETFLDYVNVNHFRGIPNFVLFVTRP